jgi:hypothetical protein
LAFTGDIYSFSVRVIEEPPPDLHGIADWLPPGFCALIMRTLAKKPSDRPQSMGELHEELRQWQRSTASPSGEFVARLRTTQHEIPAISVEPNAPIPIGNSNPTTRTPTGAGEAMRLPTGAQPRRRSMGLLAGALVVGLGGAIGITAWLMRKSPTGESKSEPAATQPAPIAQPPTAAVKSRLRISSKPSGAQVSEGGKPLGVTPLVVEGEPGQRRRFRLQADGYTSLDEEGLFGTDDTVLDAALVASTVSASAAAPSASVAAPTAVKAKPTRTHSLTGERPHSSPNAGAKKPQPSGGLPSFGD